MITPFSADGKINEKTVRDMVEFYLRQGADGFYILGSTGEGLLMSEDDRRTMCEIVIEQVRGRKPVLCHVAAMNQDEAVRLARHAEQTGADAVSAIPPIFFHYSPEDIYRYYASLAGSVHIPFVIYNYDSSNAAWTQRRLQQYLKLIQSPASSGRLTIIMR